MICVAVSTSLKCLPYHRGNPSKKARTLKTAIYSVLQVKRGVEPPAKKKSMPSDEQLEFQISAFSEHASVISNLRNLECREPIVAPLADTDS